MSGFMRFAALALLGSATLPLLSATPAAAVVVDVGGISYDVSVSSMSYTLNPTSFDLPPVGQMPWWGDSARASEFATKVLDQLGPGWDPDYGPVFAYSIAAPQNEVLGLTQSLTDINDQIDVRPATSATISYATATAPVPLPLPLLGATVAYRCSRRLKARLRQCNRSTCSPISTPAACSQ
jgi:hypothetical protein